MAAPLCYLDFDGLLHCADVYVSHRRGAYVTRGSLFEHAHSLVEALEGFPTVAIVLSTSWVAHYGFTKARSRLPRQLQQRVIGATFHRRHTPNWHWQTRYEQIAADARRRQCAVWVALDDDAAEWPEHQRYRLIDTDPSIGLQPADLARLTTVLSQLTCQQTDSR